MHKLYSIVTCLIILGLFLFGGIVSSWNISINFSGGCLTGAGNECFTIDSEDDRTVLTVAQDVIFAATYMVGTVLTLVIIYCGLMYIFASRNGKDDVGKYKTGLINAAIGAVLVRGAYAIVRLIQYIAKG